MFTGFSSGCQEDCLQWRSDFRAERRAVEKGSIRKGGEGRGDKKKNAIRN